MILAFKKTIVIQNLTPIGGTFTVEATNFYALDKDNTECDKMNDVLTKLNIRKKGINDIHFQYCVYYQ